MLTGETVILNISYAGKFYYSQSPFLPIMAGGRTTSDDVIADDTGDNINSKNLQFGELTAIYWAWKNLKNVDVIGVSHYRRYLMPTKHIWGKLHYDLSWNQFLGKKYDISNLINEFTLKSRQADR